jgi:hypothetical protein
MNSVSEKLRGWLPSDWFALPQQVRSRSLHALGFRGQRIAKLVDFRAVKADKVPELKTLGFSAQPTEVNSIK